MAVVIYLGGLNQRVRRGEWGELGRAVQGRDSCVLSDTVGLSPVGALRGEAAPHGAWGGRGPALWSSAESSESHQMRLLLVKRGSVLPLYLRLVIDHLRLFTLYEQVGGGCEPSLLIFCILTPFPILHSSSSSPSLTPSHPPPSPVLTHAPSLLPSHQCFLLSLPTLFPAAPSPTHNLLPLPFPAPTEAPRASPPGFREAPDAAGHRPSAAAARPGHSGAGAWPRRPSPSLGHS